MYACLSPGSSLPGGEIFFTTSGGKILYLYSYDWNMYVFKHITTSLLIKIWLQAWFFLTLSNMLHLKQNLNHSDLLSDPWTWPGSPATEPYMVYYFLPLPLSPSYLPSCFLVTLTSTAQKILTKTSSLRDWVKGCKWWACQNPWYRKQGEGCV